MDHYVDKFYLCVNCCNVHTVHVPGILIFRFHAIFWPAFLMAAGLDLPKRIICHAHWTVDGYKVILQNIYVLLI